MGISDIELEFLDHSNRIENERSKEALEDAKWAWSYFIGERRKPIFSTKSVLYCHYLLMRRLRPDIAGRLRDCDVWIGGRHCRFISESLIREDLDFLFEDEMQIEGRIDEDDAKKFTKICHVTFEKLHPFEDGNGRVGRIIYNAHRLKLGLPIHVIHKGEEQMEYYKWFK